MRVRLTSHARDARCLRAAVSQYMGVEACAGGSYLRKLGWPGVCDAGRVGVSGFPADETLLAIVRGSNRSTTSEAGEGTHQRDAGGSRGETAPSYAELAEAKAKRGDFEPREANSFDLDRASRAFEFTLLNVTIYESPPRREHRLPNASQAATKGQSSDVAPKARESGTSSSAMGVIATGHWHRRSTVLR